MLRRVKIRHGLCLFTKNPGNNSFQKLVGSVSREYSTLSCRSQASPQHKKWALSKLGMRNKLLVLERTQL